MKSLMSLIIGALREAGYEIEVAEAHQIVRLHIAGDAARWKTFVRILPTLQLVIYSTPDVTVPEPRRVAVAEFLTRANFGLAVGNFELDFDDGEVRFKTSIDSNGEPFAKEILLNLLNANLANTNRYLPGVMGVAFGDVAPAEAVRRCEVTDDDR